MESIGSKLAQARAEKGVSVEQAARDTHISKRFIDAMEAEDFDQFPGEAYLLGFLRNYAGYLDLGSDEIVSLYHNIRLQEQPAPIDELLDRRPPGAGLLRFLPYVLVLVVIGLLVGLFAGGVISLPERRERPDPDAGGGAAVQPFPLSEQFVERRFTQGDRVAVPVDGAEALLEFLSIGQTVAVGSEAGIVQLSSGEERLLDLTGEGSGDIRLAVRQIYQDEQPPAVVVRLDRVVDGDQAVVAEPTSAVTDEDVADLGMGMTNVAARERDARILAEFPALQEYFIEADIRGLTMFRWQVDDQEQEERYLQNGDRVRTSVREVVRLWASNAGNVRLRIAGNPVELGGQGEVVAAVIRWRELEAGGFALELLPMY